MAKSETKKQADLERELIPPAVNLSKALKVLHFCEFWATIMFICVIVFITIGFTIVQSVYDLDVKNHVSKSLIDDAFDLIKYSSTYLRIVLIIFIVLFGLVIYYKKLTRKKRAETVNLIVREVQSMGYKLSDMRYVDDNLMVKITKKTKNGEQFERRFWL